jgi:hypothetical protein
MKRRQAVSACLFILLSLVASSCRPSAPSGGLSPADEIAAFPAPVSYDLTLDIEYDTGMISGDCMFTLKNEGDQPVPVVPLNLYRLMEVSSVTDDEGTDLEFTQNARIFEDWRELQVNHIRVRIDPPLPPGGEKTLRIRYGGLLLGYTEAMRYVKDHVSPELTMIRTDSFVYPEIGVPSWETNRSQGLKDFGYTVSLTVPSSLVVANAGELVSKNERDGRTTWVYKDRVPSWRIDLAVSKYETIEAEEGRLRIFSFPEDVDGARELLDSLTGTMDLYTRWFGPLKVFPGLTVIEVPAGYGSQADVAAVIQEADAFKDPSGRYTFYHELSHLWNVKGTDRMPPRFESEGLAMFLQHFVQEKLEGKTGAVAEAVDTSLARMAKYFGEHPDHKTVPMIEYGDKQLTDLSYRMGQILFFLLYEVLGEEAFLETAGSFYREYYDTGATARQFVDHVKKQSAVDLDTLFEEWVFTAKAADLLTSGTSRAELVRRYR